MKSVRFFIHFLRHPLFFVLSLSLLPISSVYTSDPVEEPKAETASHSIISVNVLGQVTRQGRYPLPKGATVLDALAAAGGQGIYADMAKTRILRRNSEKQEEIVINLKEVMAGKTPATLLKDGDTMVLDQRLWNY